MARQVGRLASGRPPGVAAVYCAVGSELDVQLTAAALRQEGWQLAWPRVIGDREVAFHLAQPHELRAGYRSILEPPADAPRVDVDSLDLLLVPGLGFDRRGHRLGQGGGFYDRILASSGRPEALGVAYAVQVLPSLPCEPWDLPVDRVVTERGLTVDGVWSLL